MTPTESGKGWEYGLARKFADVLNTVLEVNPARIKSQDYYDLFSPYDRNRIDRAAGEVASFLRAHDVRFENTQSMRIQGDKAGKEGDVRDILFFTDKEQIGISAKHRHYAVKHSRLSGTNDFGEKWYGVPCSDEYWDTVTPIFDHLRFEKEMGVRWADLPNKHDAYYVPILEAFMTEVRQYSDTIQLLSYLLGRYDFYKVIKENGDVSIQSFNMSGQLKWGNRLRLSGEIHQLSMKSNSKTTAMMYIDTGWQISFRIHSASGPVEPSLKFDVQLIGSPQLSSHPIPYLAPSLLP